jgi:hypothetical protein
MAVDYSGVLADSLYVVWSQRVSLTRSDIALMKGHRAFSGTGVAWDTENILRVSMDTETIRFWPWISWDECTGMLAVVFVENSSPGVFQVKVAVSETHGTSWTELQVSDVPWDGTVAEGYDFIQIATGDGRALPVWSDNRVWPGTANNSAYVSPIQLWGIVQDSVSATATINGDGTMNLTMMWDTNLSANADDRATASSPNGVQYTSPACSTCAGPDGKTHTVTLAGIPCEPGTWTYTVSSRRSGCLESRTSDPKTFFVPPDVALFGHWPPTAGHVGKCPAGDPVGYDFTVDVGFTGSCVSTVTASRLTLEALSKDHTPPKLAFFPQGVPQPADSAATAGSGFATAITERQVGGCGSDSAWVYLDGIGIGKAYVPFVPNFDLNNTGSVDAADLASFSSALGTCAGHPSYNSCADFAGYDDCVNASDIAALAAHLGHLWSNPQFKSQDAGRVTKLRLEPGAPPGSTQVAVRLEGLRGRSAYGVVLRPAATRLRFDRWVPGAGHESTTAVVDTLDGEGRRLVVLAFDLAPDAAGNVDLGSLVFRTSTGDATLEDVGVDYEDVAMMGGVEIAASGRQPWSAPSSNRLLQNSPNPSNPITVIHYTLGEETDVRIAIYDIAGREVHVLVRARQPAGEHAATWDGRDSSGHQLGSGVYVYRLVAGGVQQSRKLVVLR